MWDRVKETLCWPRLFPRQVNEACGGTQVCSGHIMWSPDWWVPLFAPIPCSPNPCGTGAVDIGGISNNTHERKIFYGCRKEKKYKMYDSPNISEEIFWQFWLILTVLAVEWHLCSSSPMCPCPGTVGSVYLALYESSVNIQCVCKCRLLHALTTWSNSEQLLGHYLHEECVWVYHYAKGIRHTC